MKYSTIINKIVSKYNTRPILQNFHFKDGRLHCTDFEIGLTFTYPKLDILVGNDFCVDAKMLSKLMDNKGLLSGNVEERTLELQLGKSKFKLPAYPADDFPDMPILETETFELNEHFMEALKRTSHCAQTEENRLLLNSIKLDFQNGYAISTDQVRLSAQKIQN